MGADREGSRFDGRLIRHNHPRGNDEAAAAIHADYAGRRASDSQSPPPINATPDKRPSSFARDDCMNHARPSPAAIPHAESVKAASTTETAHITAS